MTSTLIPSCRIASCWICYLKQYKLLFVCLFVDVFAKPMTSFLARPTKAKMKICRRRFLLTSRHWSRCESATVGVAVQLPLGVDGKKMGRQPFFFLTNGYHSCVFELMKWNYIIWLNCLLICSFFFELVLDCFLVLFAVVVAVVLGKGLSEGLIFFRRHLKLRQIKVIYECGFSKWGFLMGFSNGFFLLSLVDE